MTKKFAITLAAALLMFLPQRALAVEGDENTMYDNSAEGNTYYEEPQYNNTYEDPGYNGGYQNGGDQNNSAENSTDWNSGGANNGYDESYNNGTGNESYNNQNGQSYTEPYTEPYTETEPAETYTEPYTEPYEEAEEEYTEPEVYIEPEPEPEPEVQSEPEPELSINEVQGEGYTVSGVVTGSDEAAENVTLILSNGSDTIETVSDASGEFLFTDVANGTYTLSAADSDAYEAVSEPLEVTVENRNKLGYEITVEPAEETEPPAEAPEEEAEEKEETKEELPVEEAETDQQSADASDGMSAFELILISAGTILLLAAVGIALFRKLSQR